MLKLYLAIAIVFSTLPGAVSAQCRIAIAGTNCVSVPQSQKAAPKPGPVKVGDMLERGEYSMLLNASYYGLSGVADGWVYMRIEEDIYRVDWNSHEVLERVTDQANANW